MRDIFVFRAQVYRHIREFFTARGYVEVETPMLVSCPGAEAYLRYFAVDWLDNRNQKQKRFLRSSPELHMKQLLSAGLPKIFQLGKCFRNGGEYSNWHHPEFALLEWYETHITFEQFMDLSVTLLTELFQKYSKSPLGSFKKITIKHAFAEFVGINLIDNDPELACKAQGKGCHAVNDDDDFTTAFFKILLDVIEPRLRELGSVVLYDYPPSQAALAKVTDGVAKRFEIYLSGIEICNAFLECTDKEQNLVRFSEISASRKKNKLEAIAPDRYFISALEKGLPPSCGNALGLDRLLALLRGAKDLTEVIPFREQLST